MPAAEGYFTPDEVVAGALAELNEETPSALQASYTRDKLYSLHAHMTKEGYADWPLSMCPLEAYDGVITILAGRCAERVRGMDAASAMDKERVGWARYHHAMNVPAALSGRADYF